MVAHRRRCWSAIETSLVQHNMEFTVIFYNRCFLSLSLFSGMGTLRFLTFSVVVMSWLGLLSVILLWQTGILSKRRWNPVSEEIGKSRLLYSAVLSGARNADENKKWVIDNRYSLASTPLEMEVLEAEENTALKAAINTGKKLTILMWVTPPWIGMKQDDKMAYCSRRERSACEFVKDRKLLSQSDVLLLDLATLGDVIDTELHKMIPRNPKTLWLAYVMESPLWPGIRHVSTQFNITASYDPRSTLWVPYGRCKRRTAPLMNLQQTVNYAQGKSRQVAWLVSVCTRPSKRMQYAKELSKYITVDIIGACGNDTICPRSDRNYNTCDKTLRSTYKFYLSFENSFCDYYMTEKVFRMLVDDTRIIPIVLGAGPYKRYLPPDSYLDVHNFSSPEHLAAHLHHLDNDDVAYNRYFKWRKTYKCHLYSDKLVPCAICRRLMAMDFTKQYSANLDQTRNRAKVCKVANHLKHIPLLGRE